jgi:Uma2 family endonuclease
MTMYLRLAVEDFDEWILLPENTDSRFEFIGGEIVEVVSNQRSSAIASIILGEIYIYLRQNPIGFLTAPDGGYEVAGERYMPDVGFISKQKQLSVPDVTYNEHAPDLAVEVVSPTDSSQKLSIKIANYLAAQTVVWAVYPITQEVVVYRPAMPVKVLGLADVLDGGEILPNFQLPVKTIFTQD